MKKKLFFLWAIIMLLLPLLSSGQSVERQLISSFGELSQTEDLSVSATLGEWSIQTARSPIIILTVGFQQPNPEDLVGVLNPSNTSLEIIAYPNPLFQKIKVAFKSKEDFPAYYNIWDTKGKKMKALTQFQLNSNTQLLIDCSHWEGGQYYLSVFDEQARLLRTLKIIKL